MADASGYYVADTEYKRDLEGNESRYVLETCFSHPSFGSEVMAEGLAWALSFVAVEAGGGADAIHCWRNFEMRLFYRYFFRHLVTVLEHLESRQAFLDTFLATGGGIMFTLRLDGWGNIGDALPPETLMRLARLGVRLRIKVVPVWPEA